MHASRFSFFRLAAVGLLTLPLLAAAQSGSSILHAPEAAKLLPGAVYFDGQSASTQLRNSAGVRFSGNAYVLAVLVDNSGYSTAVQQKYQGYLLTEVPLSIGGHALPPGAYGVGFVHDRFLVMDIGNHDLLQTDSSHDGGMQHPTPLQILSGSSPGTWRLCFGRDCVDFRQGH